MRAFVTGATGFVGSWLARLLVREGETVATLCQGHPALCVARTEGNLLDLDPIHARAWGFAPDGVFRQAWCGAGKKHRNDRDQVRRNLTNSLALLELAAEAGCRTEYGSRDTILQRGGVNRPLNALRRVRDQHPSFGTMDDHRVGDAGERLRAANRGDEGIEHRVEWQEGDTNLALHPQREPS